MKTPRYTIAFLALFTGLLISCKKETKTEEIGVDNYDTTASDTTAISGENETDSISGSGLNGSANTGNSANASGSNNQSGGTNSPSNGSNAESAESKTGAKTGRNTKNDSGVDMTKDTIMTPASKMGSSGTPGSGKGNTRK